MQKNDFKGKDPEPSDEQLAVSAAKGASYHTSVS